MIVDIIHNAILMIYKQSQNKPLKYKANFSINRRRIQNRKMHINLLKIGNYLLPHENVKNEYIHVKL